MIKRAITELTVKLVDQYQVLSISAPRESGKITLAKSIFPEFEYVNQEHPAEGDFTLLILRDFKKCFDRSIIDEFQGLLELTSSVKLHVE